MYVPLLLFLFSASYWLNSHSRNLYPYLEALGARERSYSRTLGIASFELPDKVSDFKRIKGFDTLFIPVARGKFYDVQRVETPNYADNDFIYRLLGVKRLHESGFYGQNIVIGVFDTGFDSTHPAIAPIFSEGRVVATYDFNSGDHILHNNEFMSLSDSMVYINKVVLKDSFLVVSYATVDNLALNNNAYALVVLTPHTRTLLSQNERAIEPDVLLKNDTLFVVSQVVDGGIFQIKLFVIPPAGNVSTRVMTSSTSDKLFPSIEDSGDTVFLSFIDKGVGVRKIALFDTGVVQDDTFYIDGFLTFQKTTGNYILCTTPDSIHLFKLESDTLIKVFQTEGFYPAFDLPNNLLYFSTTKGFFKYELARDTLYSLSTHILTSFPEIGMHGDVYVTFDDFGAYKISGNRISKIADGIFDGISVYGSDFVLRQRGDRGVQPDTKEPYNMHGTEMLSLIGGFWEGRMVGIAPMAKFVLCKTERGYSPQGNDFENIIEEDFWVEAFEFAHFQGARIISSSLGYRDWYTPEQLDGNTPISSRVASKALSMGMIVVNAMGNADHADIPPSGDTTLVAPADARNIIAVGGCDSTGTRPALCSYGPSGDGRIKPEIVAPFNAYYTDSSGATYWLGGTSISTAIVSGIIAAVWSAKPEISAEFLRNSVLASAIKLPGYPEPNNITGYGRIDASSLLDTLNVKLLDSKDVIFLSPYPNPAPRSSDVIHLPIKFAHRGDGVIKVFTIDGILVKELAFQSRGPGIIDIPVQVNDLAPGLYVALCHTGFGSDRVRFVILPR